MHAVAKCPELQKGISTVIIKGSPKQNYTSVKLCIKVIYHQRTHLLQQPIKVIPVDGKAYVVISNCNQQ